MRGLTPVGAQMGHKEASTCSGVPLRAPRPDSARPAPTPPRIAAAQRLRNEIEKAEADGVRREDMLLRLTFGDVNQLKRDTSLAVDDISFAGRIMRFLGVRIEQGGVAESVLQLDEGPP